MAKAFDTRELGDVLSLTYSVGDGSIWLGKLDVLRAEGLLPPDIVLKPGQFCAHWDVGCQRYFLVRLNDDELGRWQLTVLRRGWSPADGCLLNTLRQSQRTAYLGSRDGRKELSRFTSAQRDERLQAFLRTVRSLKTASPSARA